MTRSRGLLALYIASALMLAISCSSKPDQSQSAVTTAAAASSPAAPSTGCASPDETFANLGDAGTISSGGIDRVFTLEVPPDTPDDQPLPLVVDMHGALMTRAAVDSMSQLSELGAQRQFVVVTPQALGERPIWDVSESGPDVRYVQELIDHIEAELCIDTNRVYLTGFSMGGMMTMVLACVHPERYAAIAPVAGAVSVDNCTRATPVPLIAFHGTADRDVRFDGTFADAVAPLVPYESGIPRDQVVQAWAEGNGCGVPATDTKIPPDVDHDMYSCAPDASVEMYVIDEGGHTWPGSTPGPYSATLAGKTTTTVNASDLIWSFFQQHARTG